MCILVMLVCRCIGAFALLSVARDSLCVTVSFHFDYKTFLTQPTVVTGKGTIPSHAACR